MKKYFILILVGLCWTNVVKTQEDSSKEDTLKVRIRDVFTLDLNYCTWQNAPSNYGLRALSLGTNFSAMKNIPFKGSNFAFAVGLGIGCDNYKSKEPLFPTYDTASKKITLSIDSTGVFSDIKNNKLSTTFLDIPVEFRFHTNPNKNNRSLKFSVGFKGGYLINSHTKYNGKYNGNDQLSLGETGDIIKYKKSNIKNIQKFRYGIYGRIGFDKFGFTAFYALSTFFEEDKFTGPELIPFTIGICFTPY